MNWASDMKYLLRDCPYVLLSRIPGPSLVLHYRYSGPTAAIKWKQKVKEQDLLPKLN
jgi:hypothetical protein